MDHSSIASRTEKVRREIELIQQEERNYPSQKSHSLAENAGQKTPECFEFFTDCKDSLQEPEAVRQKAQIARKQKCAKLQRIADVTVRTVCDEAICV